MRQRRSKRMGLGWLAMAVLALAGLVGEARADLNLTGEISWVRYPVGCLPEGTPDLMVRCGSLGTYAFDELLPGAPAPAAPRNCSQARLSSEVPPAYPRQLSTSAASAGSALEQAGVDSLWEATGPPGPGSLGTAPLPLSAPTIPCENGSCYTKVWNLGQRPWVAVIDWNDAHGWTVGWTLRQTLAPEAALALFSLSSRNLASLSARGATDVHVLTKLCEVLDLVDSGTVRPPLAINLSFGRLDRSADPVLGGGCGDRNLACQIAEVVTQLTQRTEAGRQPAVVAAAGNHRKPLFPAALSTVVAAGGLDVERLRADRVAAPLWEVPTYPTKDVSLLPSNGLCLPFGPGLTRRGWPAPAGSSYAAAVLSGWLGSSLLAGEVQAVDPGQRFRPEVLCSGSTCSYQLVQGSLRLAAGTQLASAFLNRSLIAGGASCSQSRAWGSPAAARLGLEIGQGEDVLPVPSQVEAAAATHRPAPDTDPCVPCAGFQPPKGGPAKVSQSGTVLTVDLTSGSALPNRFAIEAIYLERRGLLWQVDVTSADLAALTKGQKGRLEITNLGRPLSVGEAPSLVFVLRHTRTGSPPERFWSSVPILVGRF